MAEYIPKDKAVEACFYGWNNNAHDCAMYHGPNWFCADGEKREETII